MQKDIENKKMSKISSDRPNKNDRTKLIEMLGNTVIALSNHIVEMRAEVQKLADKIMEIENVSIK